MNVRTYVRPTTGWWRRNPWYRAYMLREASSLFVTLYALVLLAGIACLVQGRAAYDGWRAALASPWSIAFHVVALGFFLCHAWSWFAVMPKTMPFVTVGGRRLADRAIVAAGAAAAVGASLLVFVVVWATQP